MYSGFVGFERTIISIYSKFVILFWFELFLIFDKLKIYNAKIEKVSYLERRNLEKQGWLSTSLGFS